MSQSFLQVPAIILGAITQTFRQAPSLFFVAVLLCWLLSFAVLGDLADPTNYKRAQARIEICKTLLEIFLDDNGIWYSISMACAHGLFLTLFHLRHYPGRSLLFSAHLSCAMAILYVFNAYILSDRIAWSTLTMLAFLAMAGPDNLRVPLHQHLRSSFTCYAIVPIAVMIRDLETGLQAFSGLVMGYVWWRWCLPIRDPQPIARAKDIVRWVGSRITSA